MHIKFYTDEYMVNINSDCVPNIGDEVKLKSLDSPAKVSRVIWCPQDERIGNCVAIFFEGHKQTI